ncbi:MAG: hypothetical protein GX552_13460 [Chloroflexi bacterium]|nr:hypothetical protein [Chloroflexota bacterium]
MKQWMWFATGFGIALVLIGTAILGLYQRALADDTVPTLTATTQPALTPRPTEDAATPVPVLPSLAWQREGGASGACDTLRVDEANRLYFGLCQQGAVFAFLTQAELDEYQAFIAQYASFEYAAQEHGAQVQLSLASNGSHTASLEEQAEVARWAGRVYERLAEEQRQADKVARARLELAGKLGISADYIRTLSVEPVTWTDACLEIPHQGLFCAQVLTPGYRVVLEVDGRQYEYHTDRHELVRLADAPQPTASPEPTALPTDAPTHTPVPTNVPPTATPVPTWTPWPTPTPYPTATPWPTPYPVTITDWRGEYYNNPSLSGSPVMLRNDQEVSFDWGYNGPGWPVPTDWFSARWSRKIQFSEGKYNFRLEADDGVRLWVAGNLLIDRWSGGYKVDTVRNQQIWNGVHEIVVEYYEQEGSAKVRLTWEKVEEPRTPTPRPTITEWQAEYYNNMTLTGDPRIVRNEKTIAFDWGKGSPDRKVKSDGFSARFTRTLPFEQGVYRFYAVADDGVRVYVDDELLIDEWHAGIREEYTADIALDGSHALRIEYFEKGGGAALDVRWERIQDAQGWSGSRLSWLRLPTPSP